MVHIQLLCKCDCTDGIGELVFVLGLEGKEPLFIHDMFQR